MSPIVGIDLGTTNSLVAYFEAGFPGVLADEAGRRLTPSVVHYPQGGEPIVGDAAARMRVVDPERTIYSAKRFIGRRQGEDAAAVGYRLAGRPGEPVRIVAGERELAPEEVAAEILRKLRADASRALGQPVSRAVITVPAYFNDAQRSATHRAGELAGFTVERIVSEPTAAALAYGLERLGERARVAVYDLGGGTFDLSILELGGGVFQVLSTHGDTQLGGDDIDASLMRYLAEAAGVGDSAGLPPEVTARLREAATEVKHRLSAAEQVEVALPFLQGERSAAVIVTRAQLEAVARSVVERTRAHCLRALSDAHLTAADLGAVVLAGGQTRMPLVRRFVAEIFGREPDSSQHPDEVVALGAAIQAGILAGTVRDMVLLDVTPLSLGIETFGGLMNVIIPRNTTIPCKAGELFTNALAGQERMSITVLQGERELARDCWELGRFELAFTPAPKGKARVGVQFEIDANGILHVLARDTETGRQTVVELRSAVDVSDEAVEKMLEESLEHAFEDMAARVFTEGKMKAEEMLPAVDRAIAQVGDALPPEDRALIDAGVAEVRRCLEAGAGEPLRRALAALDDATQRLAALVVERAMRRTPR